MDWSTPLMWMHSHGQQRYRWTPILLGGIGCVIAVAIANFTSVKSIKKLDLVEVLKERE